MSRTRTPLAVTSVFNLLANLLFPVLAVRALGTGNASDALFLVFILPPVITVLLGNSVLNWSTPRLVRRTDPAGRRALCWSLAWTLLAGVGLLCLLLWLGAQALAPRLAAGGSYALAIALFPAGAVAVLAAVLTAVSQSLYTAERDVLGSELRTLATNVIAGVAWLVVAPATLESCALLFALRPVLAAAALLPRLGRPRAPDLADPDLRGVLRESRVLLLAATYYKSEPFVDRLLFASVSGGVVAAFHLAHQVMSVVTNMMNRVVTATLVAPLAESVHAGDGPGSRRLLRRAAMHMAFTGCVFWVLFLLLGEPLLRLLLRGTATAAADAALTAHILVLMGGYMLGVLVGQVLGQAFYATGDTRTVVRVGIGIYTLGLLFKGIGLWLFGATGLVAAISLTWLVNLALFRWTRPALFRPEAGAGDDRVRT